MVAGCYYDGHFRTGLVNVQHGVGVHLLRGGGRGRIVVDVSAYDHCIRLLFGCYPGELRQKGLLLDGTVVVIEGMSQVPVAGM